MAIQSGTLVGPYEIVSAIGAGGIGEVYRARDSKLGRDVGSKCCAKCGSKNDRKEVTMRTFWFMTAVLCLAAPVAVGQTKVSGTESCGKPSSQQALHVGDDPGHAMVIGEWHCTWSKPFQIAGAQVKDDVNTQFSDSSGNTSQVRGYSIGTMDNGDKYFVRFQGTLAIKEGMPQSGGGTWNFFGGTGKLKSLRGKGTWKETSAEGVGTTQMEGEYELPK